MLKLRIFEAQPEFLYSYEKTSVYNLLYVRLKYIEEIGKVCKNSKIWEKFVSINFRELINLGFFAYFTFAYCTKIREIREYLLAKVSAPKVIRKRFQTLLWIQNINHNVYNSLTDISLSIPDASSVSYNLDYKKFSTLSKNSFQRFS